MTRALLQRGVVRTLVDLDAQSGYEELQPQYATLTINKATPARPLAPVVTGVTDSSITIEVVDGMAYSIDGGVTWQTTDTFTGLNRDTTYEIKVKAVETACYKELEGPSTMQATEKTVVTFERFADQTVEYTGHAQTYTLPKSNPGIASMTITGYDGIATPPVTVGDYVVNIDFVAAEGYKLPEILPAPVLHITRVSGEAGTVRPVLKDETVTYTGDPQRYHGADGIEGISSVALTYTGADGVESTTAPTNAGVYHVTAIFSPDGNHTLAPGNYSATVEKLILTAIREVSAYVREDEKEFIRIVRDAASAGQEQTAREKKKRLRQVEKRIGELDELIRKLYEGNATGKIPDKHFNRLLVEYDTEQSALEQEAAELKEGITAQAEDGMRAQRFVSLVRRYTSFSKYLGISEERIEGIAQGNLDCLPREFGLQGFFIMICVAIYAVLIGQITSGTNLHIAIWQCAGYTVLLCFSLFKTGSVSRSIFNAH